MRQQRCARFARPGQRAVHRAHPARATTQAPRAVRTRHETLQLRRVLPSLSAGSDVLLPRRWRALRKLSRLALGLVLLLWTVLLAAWLALHWIILPHIDEWRPAIEKHLSQALGTGLRIGAIHASSSSWVPAVQLNDVRLLDADGREALQLGQLNATLSAQALLAGKLRFDQLLIDGAQLEVRRDAEGRVHLGGLDLGTLDGSDDSPWLDWLLEQHEVVVRDAQLRWIDERRDTAPVVLQQVDVVLRSGLRRHALRLDATPPPAWGERFSVRGRFTRPLLSNAAALRRWNGTLYAEWPLLHLAHVQAALGWPSPGVDGDVGAQAWLDIRRGTLRAATLDLAAPELG